MTASMKSGDDIGAHFRQLIRVRRKNTRYSIEVQA